MPILFFSSRSRHTSFDCDWSSDVCSSDLLAVLVNGHGGATVPAAAGGQPSANGHAPAAPAPDRNSPFAARSEERRVGKEWSFTVSTDRYKKKVAKVVETCKNKTPDTKLNT